VLMDYRHADLRFMLALSALLKKMTKFLEFLVREKTSKGNKQEEV
jgi:hypothetical protein